MSRSAGARGLVVVLHGVWEVVLKDDGTVCGLDGPAHYPDAVVVDDYPRLIVVVVGHAGSGRRSGALRGALATAVGSAARNLLVASPTVDPDRLAVSLAESADAVRRRVRIDILPGTTLDGFDQAAVLDTVNRVGYQTAGSNGRALLRTGPHATGSGASLLLYDDDSGRLVAIVGDHDLAVGEGAPRHVADLGGLGGEI